MVLVHIYSWMQIHLRQRDSNSGGVKTHCCPSGHEWQQTVKRKFREPSVSRPVRGELQASPLRRIPSAGSGAGHQGRMVGHVQRLRGWGQVRCHPMIWLSQDSVSQPFSAWHDWFPWLIGRCWKMVSGLIVRCWRMVSRTSSSAATTAPASFAFSAWIWQKRYGTSKHFVLRVVYNQTLPLVWSACFVCSLLQAIIGGVLYVHQTTDSI